MAFRYAAFAKSFAVSREHEEERVALSTTPGAPAASASATDSRLYKTFASSTVFDARGPARSHCTAVAHPPATLSEIRAWGVFPRIKFVVVVVLVVVGVPAWNFWMQSNTARGTAEDATRERDGGGFGGGGGGDAILVYILFFFFFLLLLPSFLKGIFSSFFLSILF